MDEETIRQALYLCDYYLHNARPMINIIKEGGLWNNERRIIKHLAKQPARRDTHSNVMNELRLKAKELGECIRNLVEQNAINVEYENTPNAKKKTTFYTLLPNAVAMYCE